ncbi:MOP flippase family protein [Enterobacter ludwigii]
MGLLSNAKWNTCSQLVKIIVQIINIIYLTKIIPPKEYGILAMAMVVFNFGILLRDLGTSSAIIQSKSISSSLKNTVFWINVILGGGLCAITIFLSPTIARLYKELELSPILMILSLSFPLTSAAALHISLLERESQFKKISLIEISAALISIIIAISLAKFGFGVYSLAISLISMNFVSLILFWFVSKWRPSISSFINKEDVKIIFNFSANLTLFNFINYFSRNADSFLIGKFMSASILGSYNLAYRIMLFPIQSLSFIVTRSLFPILSRMQDDDDDIRNVYYDCVFFILFLTMPMMIGLAILSDKFVSLVIGPQWFLSGDILHWLAPIAIIQAVLSTTGSVFMAKGRTDILMRLGFFGAFIQCTAFIIGVNFSIIIFSKLYLLANILNFLPVMYFLLKLINGNAIKILKLIFPIVMSCCAMSVFIIFVMGLPYHYFVIDSLIKLLLISLLGAFIYFLFITMLSSKVKKMIKFLL